MDEHILCFLTASTKLEEQDLVAKEMIAVPISEPLKMALVASPDYLAQHGSPKNIDDLQQHPPYRREALRRTRRGDAVGIQIQKRADYVHAQIAVFHQ